MVQASLPQPIPRPAERATPTTAGRRLAARLPRGDAGRRLAYRAVSAPLWFGSDLPAPLPPAREPAPVAALGPAGEVVVLGLGQIARRLWLRHALHILVRALWVGLALGCAWLLVELAGGPALDPVALAWVGGLLLLLGLAFALLSRPGRRRTARMLDRTFGLQERLTTAVDHLGRGVPRDGERASVVYLQMADAANAVAELRRHRLLGVRVPVRELVLAVFFGLLLATLYFLRGVGGDVPPLAAAAVPAFTPAAERPPEPEPPPPAGAEPAELAPTVEEVRARAERSQAAQRDLQALARALDDHAVTRSAAEAIGQGEFERAADALRELAPDANELSEAARGELAGDLEQAASEMAAAGQEPGSQGLGASSQRAADGLRQGEQAAQEGVRDLGEAVERTAGEVASQGELAEQMRQAQEAAAQGQRRSQQAGQQGQQGQPGAQGEAGDPSQGDPGQPGEGQPGEQGGQPGQAPSEGQPGEAGQGQEGQPGGDSQAGGQQPGSQAGQPGQAGAPGSEAGQPGEAGQEGQPGQGQQGGQPGQGQPGEGGGDQAAGDGPQSGQGGGAGGGEGQEQGQDGASQSPSGGGEGGDQTGQGASGEEQIGQGGGEGVAGGEPAPVVETIQLPSAPEGEGVQTSADAGSSSRGSGAGITAGAGSTVQGDVGESGPDSNRVPPDYRDLVEDYFSQPESNQ